MNEQEQKEEIQKQFLAYLYEKSGALSEEELKQYIDELGDEGVQREYATFVQSMEQGPNKVQEAKHGGTLEYIQYLRQFNY